MILCIGDAVPPTTEKSRVLRKILIFIIIFQIFIGVGKLYYDLWSGVAEFVSVLVLWCAQAQLNYCNCVIYIFFCMMNCFSILVYFATDIQNQVDLLKLEFYQRYYFMLSVISLTFYIVGIYFAFQAYKEFKGIAYDVLAATSNDNISFSKQQQQINQNYQLNPQTSQFGRQEVSQYIPQINEHH